jgi:phosphate starvation-inducible protein PhoH
LPVQGPARFWKITTSPLSFSTTTACLPRSFGEHDEHLALIERRLGVDIAPRGNRIAIKGPVAERDNAQKVLSQPL